MALRLIEAVLVRLRSDFGVVSIVKDFALSTGTITCIFVLVSFKLNDLPKVLSIDEFKGTTDKGKYHCILVDPINSKVLDIHEHRSLDFLLQYFSRFKNRNIVQYVIMVFGILTNRQLSNYAIMLRLFLNTFNTCETVFVYWIRCTEAFGGNYIIQKVNS